ncbi:MAG: DUF2155 domain-containing protein [Rhodobacteraceae bacterium]|nr:DUF2155 domain-containing protein [Paracoccaceae bacterium]
MRRLASAALCAAFAFPVSAQVLLQQPRVEAELGDGAVLRALDKVNGQTKDTELVNGATVEMFGLLVTLEECRYPTDNPTGDAYAFLTIREPESGRLRFEGWMIASSPALSALDHNRYDVWVLRCRIS